MRAPSRRGLARSLLAATCLLLLPLEPGLGQAFHPLAYGDLGPLDQTVAGGSFISAIEIDSGATPPTIVVHFEVGPPLELQGVVESAVTPEAAVFAFSAIDLPSAIDISVTGNRPIVILSRSDLILASPIDLAAGTTGGGPGGAAGTSSHTPDNGNGPGGGGAGSVIDFGFGPAPGAGGGGGYGGGGASGGEAPGGTGGSGGVTYGSGLILQGGSGGGGGPYYDGALTVRGSDGGAGGGALELGAYGALTLATTASANGAASEPAPSGDIKATGGAGSGGMLRLHGATVDLAGGEQSVTARGASAAGGSLTGGRGGGGRIVVLRGSGAPQDAATFSVTGANAGVVQQAISALDAPAALEILHRIGASTASAGQLTVTNSGEAGSILFGTFPQAPPGLTGGDGLFGGLQASGSETADYLFSTDKHETITEDLILTSTAGDALVVLTARGVGPTPVLTQPSNGILDFGEVNPGQSQEQQITLSNETTDGDLGDPTDLTVISLEIEGPDKDLFDTPGFAPQVIAATSSTQITISLTPTTPTPTIDATLTLTTDAGNEKGVPGQTLEITLTGSSQAAPLFQDGFESGDTTAWTNQQP